MKAFFRTSQNCWKRPLAHRAAFLVDGENYFRALHHAMRQAQRSIMIVGWDLHSDLEMIRDGDAGAYPARLGRLLDFLVRKRRALRVYLLSWDFAMIYAMEREFFPRYKLKWRTHRRIRFCLDGEHPVGASQHQKVVVIDDAVAFSGGLDLSQWRWDSSRHSPRDHRRVDPNDNPYPPFHDVQMVVDGPAAAALGVLVRERWQRATGKPPETDSAPPGNHDPWPGTVRPDLRRVPIAIARTLPAFAGRGEVREVERLYLDSIAAARRVVYFENQYLSAHRIAKALERRLREPDGPEVVIVLPKRTGGWLEQHTMDVLRGRVLSKLRQADGHGRLRVYFPRVSENPDVHVMVHAKVTIIDDRFARVGSSNLSNRSLGLDSECDLAVAATAGSPEAAAIAAFRNRLLAEHLGTAPAEVKQRTDDAGGRIIEAIESLRGGPRSLWPLDGSISREIDDRVPDAKLLDPEQPIEPEAFFDLFIDPEQKISAARRVWKFALMVSALLILAMLWYWTPLERWMSVDAVTQAAKWVQRQPASPVMVPVVYMLGGLVSFPVTLMILATVFVFGPWWGLFLALIGAEASALLVFFLGRKLGRGAVERFGGSLVNRLNRKLSEAGLIAVITFRLIPVAPFSVVNAIAGISGIRPLDFAIGSLIGLVPGAAATVVMADRFFASLQHPDAANLSILLAVSVLFAGGLYALRKWLRSRHRKPAPDRS